MKIPGHRQPYYEFVFDMSSITPFPSMASKKKKFFIGSPFPDIALITSYKGKV